jgi:hypothetical protein
MPEGKKKAFFNGLLGLKIAPKRHDPYFCPPENREEAAVS